MLCPARCSCFLCRELQSCRAADSRKPPKNMCDNFILKKAEAWEPMKFIRGAARLSVRHWQNREPVSSSKARITTHKSTSCEQLYPHPSEEDMGPFGMRRAPSTDRVKQTEHKPLFKLLGNSRLKKISNSDASESKTKRSVLNFRKSDVSNAKNLHEKYIPLPQLSTPEHIYSEPRHWNGQFDDCCRPPVYQSVEKTNEENQKGSVSDRKIYNNRPPCYEELAQRLSQEKNKKSNLPISEIGLANKITQNNNKVVIYFGDSIIRKHSEQKKEENKQNEVTPQKEEAIYANRLLDETANLGLSKEVDKGGGTQMVSEIQIPEAIYAEVKSEDTKAVSDIVTINDATYKKDVFGTVSSDGFLVVEFEGNFERARQLVDLVHGGGTDHHEATVLDEDELCDWSFIQDWRKRPSSGCRPSEESAWCGGVSGARALRVRVATAGATPAPAHARRLSPPPHAHRATTPPPPSSPNKPHHEEPPAVTSETPSTAQLKAVSAVSQLTVASAPVRSAPAQSSYALERRPKHDHHHRSLETVPAVQNGRECNSSSDENRSSGHASMSDSGGAEAGREEPRRNRQPPHTRTKHRPHGKLQSPWPGGGGLEDIRSAIKQLTLRSRDSSSTATSGASSAGGGSNNGAQESGSAAEARRRRAPLVRQPSLDTVCTNVTSADEFVWVDSHNRLVELRRVPWTASEVSRALQAGRCREIAHRMAPDTPPRLAYLLQRALVRIAREAQRLSQNFGFCSKHEIAGAFRIVLSTPLADSCIKGCQRAATMYATSGSAARRLGSAARARTSLAPGRFQRWMLDVRVASFVHEYAAIYLCAGIETLLEEIALISSSGASNGPITPAAVDHAVANCADLWGLLQPYSHLNAGRIASGALSLSRWESMSSLGSGSSSGVSRPEHRQLGLSQDSGITTNGSGGSGTSAGSNTSSGGSGGSAGCASVLLTTCAGSAGELRAVLRRVQPRLPPLAAAAERALYYFMRCSQLEHNSGASGGSCGASGLWGERGAGALPPLAEWLRVLRAHASLRPPPALPDADDVLQAARLLLPHADCPPRPITLEEPIEPVWSRCARSTDELSRAALGLAQRALLSGRAELVGGVRPLLPPAGIDATDAAGLTALMKAALAGDDQIVAMLLEAGADPNIETGGTCAAHCAMPLSPRSPNTQQNAPVYTAPTAGWTALVYACSGGGGAGGGGGGGGGSALECARRLLAAGARVDGAPARGDDVCTLTPLQVACGVGNLELVQMLLSHGADPFLSTQLNDALCYSAAAQYGCYSAVAVCCTHGRRACLRAAVRGGGARAVLSLEEVLAEGAAPAPAPAPSPRPPALSKLQQRALQDAMYCSAETDHLDMTLELRALGVPWSLHAWTLSLAAAADASLDHVIDQLLQDFLQVCPSDDSHYSKQFIYECLPLLFNILRYSKKEGTVLLLADILCACYGWEPVPAVAGPAADPPPAPSRVDPSYVNNPSLADVTFRYRPTTRHTADPPPAPSRVDPSYVNNPSLADVTFRVEGRLFYGHKIVLVSESPRLRAMLAPARPAADAMSPTGATPPLVQINDIRYHIFEQVMKYLYSGGCSGLDIPENDVLEVLAAASFFQLLPLQRFCEARAAKTIDLHNLVSVYIHAKVYGATQLLEYCQGFLLQNMVALLTYDDSVKRLLFGKRLPGHNVLGALLTTLQKRIEARKNQAKPR
ncbi:ankyrin repeat and BTB/POZ domain-containing protein 2 [Achroia grisella]|uniref:ankyrin repeat and BTB/POZ domain-containing protein 2 n=1 Tax=Achroia grisella TaxID=688607 RepID=UPI0027D20BEC|nr:ankyrin repeat and BTB/POZ domain-containing protein 2 [Achroia grisella]